MQLSPSYCVALGTAVTVFMAWPTLMVAVWPTLRALFGHSDFHLFVYGTAAFHAAVFIVGNAVHVVMYYFDFQGLRKYKVEKKDWPWQRGEQNRRDFFALVRKAVGIILFNQLCIGLPLAALSFPNMVSKGWKGDQESIPGALTMVLQVAFCIVAEDFLFYWAHRSLHIRAIYPYVHRFHHKFNNKESTVGVASEAAHPIEFVFANLIPTMAGPTLLGVHQATLFLWLLVRTGETIDGHCGYDFPWVPYRILPFSGSSTHHILHHSKNRGNFGSFFVMWDSICGTMDPDCDSAKPNKAVKAA